MVAVTNGAAWCQGFVDLHRPDAVLTALADLAGTPRRGTEAMATIQRARTYLTSRGDHIRYQVVADAGYPIGSGCVESANKLVVEARLKGAGMHWARAHAWAGLNRLRGHPPSS